MVEDRCESIPNLDTQTRNLWRHSFGHIFERLGAAFSERVSRGAQQLVEVSEKSLWMFADSR